MSAKIYWFSGSGNSLFVAQAIQAGLKEAELIHVAEAGKNIDISGTVGIVFPVYAWGPPLIVSEFIRNLPSGSPDYLFAVATYGGHPGSTMGITGKMLKKRGLKLNACFTVGMVENYPPMGGAPGAEKQKEVLTAAMPVIDDIVEGIRERKNGTFGIKGGMFSIFGRIVYPLFCMGIKTQKKSKFAATDKCSSCGICARICAVENIHIADDRKPKWGLKCEQCFACFHWCPEEAIEYGRKSQGQHRYHHPEIDLKQMLIDRK